MMVKNNRFKENSENILSFYSNLKRQNSARGFNAATSEIINESA